MKLMLAEPVTMEAARAESLDQLWNEAEQLGTVEVDCSWSRRDYTVTINFTRKSGTRVLAKGSNSNMPFALGAAINEAREMGAGREA